MRALTIRQPFAARILAGEKVQEFRPWKPPALPLRILIHAAKATEEGATPDMPRSAIVGAVDVMSCEGEKGDYTWELANPQALPEPIPAQGQLGLWNPPAEILAALPDLGELATEAPPKPKGKKGRDPGWHCHCDFCSFKEVPVAAGAKRALCPKCGKWNEVEE